MPQMTIKQLGDQLRKDLTAAQGRGDLPAGLRFYVRASTKGGPKVTVTVDGGGRFIPEPKSKETTDAWLAGEGASILRAVDRIRNAYNPDPPVYGGETKWGMLLLSVSNVTTTRIGME